jgi:hypothetical protein
MPAVAATVLKDSNVPSDTSTQATGRTTIRVRARCRGVPGICESAPSATAPNNAYGAVAGAPNAYRQR